MTENEWLTSSDPAAMLAFLHGPTARSSDEAYYSRKNLLLLCGCFDRLGKLIPFLAHRWHEYAAEAAEGRYDKRKLPADAVDAYHHLAYQLNMAAPIERARLRALWNIWTWTNTPRWKTPSAEHYWNEERAEQAKLVRDIFRYPQRHTTIDSRWRTSTVVDLAHAIYEERAFERMPVLADALIDAGCDSEEIIAHCHGIGPHIRGCWVLDLLLDKR